MKTLEQIKIAIKEIHDSQEVNKAKLDDEKFAKAQKQDRTKLKMLNECRLYLESSPNEAFVKQMLSESIQKKKNIDGAFLQWLPKNVDPKSKEGRKKYDTIMNTKKIKSEIKRLKYLLD